LARSAKARPRRRDRRRIARTPVHDVVDHAGIENGSFRLCTLTTSWRSGWRVAKTPRRRESLPKPHVAAVRKQAAQPRAAPPRPSPTSGESVSTTTNRRDRRRPRASALCRHRLEDQGLPPRSSRLCLPRKTRRGEAGGNTARRASSGTAVPRGARDPPGRAHRAGPVAHRLIGRAPSTAMSSLPLLSAVVRFGTPVASVPWRMCPRPPRARAPWRPRRAGEADLVRYRDCRPDAPRPGLLHSASFRSGRARARRLLDARPGV